jgi:pimeloyl-[acyl-carrier protein] synthase
MAVMSMWSDFPPRMRRAITTATEVAAARGCEEVSPEHLLLVIAKDAESAACFIFEDAGISRIALIAELERVAPAGTANLQRASRLSPATMHVLDVATGASDKRLHHHVGTEHVALALSLVNENRASAILAGMGFTPEKAETGLRRWIKEGMPRRRGSVARSRPQSKLLRTVQSPLRKIVRYIDLGWKVYGRKSLGHPRFVTDPYPLYRWLRTHEPVRKDPIAPVRVLTRHADVQTILKDPRFKKDPFAAERLPAAIRDQLGMGEERRQDVETVSMLFLDPPQHTRVRGLLSKAFTPRMIESLRPRIQQITDRRLDKVVATGSTDVIEGLAYPLPVVVIAELLGFPPEDFSRFKKWSDALADALALNPTAEAQAAAMSAMEELRTYFDHLVRQIEKQPGDNLLSTLLAMERDRDSNGNTAAVLSREELFINSTLLLVAGHETTTNLIGNGMLALLRHRSQLQLLMDDPSLIDSAIEELLRFDSPVQWVSRVVGQRTELSGVELEPGEILLGSVGAANRDPAVFDHPDRLDIRRKDNRHLAFGSGVHFCLGAALARMEGQIAIGTMIRRLPNLRLLEKRIDWKKGLTFRSMRRLRVTFDPTPLSHVIMGEGSAG